MNRGGAARWAAIVASAAAVAGAAGALYFAAKTPLEALPNDASADRRLAAPEKLPLRVDVPLERLSRTHVGVRARAAVLEGKKKPRTSGVLVLLDTGLSLPITTPDGERLFGLGVGTGPAIVTHGVSSRASDLLPIRDSQSLFVSALPWSVPSSVATPVRHLGVDRLESAHVLLPPHLLGPRGGAVRLDLGTNRFSLCETAEACRDGAGWVAIADTPCADYPDLVVVAAKLDGVPARLLLDTGGSTIVSARFYDEHGLDEHATSTSDGDLLASGGTTVHARVTTGTWAFSTGKSGQSSSVAHTLWVPQELGGAAAACGLDGTLGIDALAGCAIVLVDGAAISAFARCAAPDGAGDVGR